MPGAETIDSDGGVAYEVEEVDVCVTEVDDAVEGEFSRLLPDSLNAVVEAVEADEVEVVPYPSLIAPCRGRAPDTGFSMEDFK